MAESHRPPTAAAAAPAAEDDDIEIVDALSPGELAAVARLFANYADSVGNILVGNPRAEANNLPGRYAPPGGALMIARRRSTGEVLGCVALRRMPGPGDSECRHLFVLGSARGHALGRRLGRAALDRARALGYRRVLLEAHEKLLAVHNVYRDVGFHPIPPYYANPAPGTIYLALDLDQAPAADGTGA